MNFSNYLSRIPIKLRLNMERRLSTETLKIQDPSLYCRSFVNGKWFDFSSSFGETEVMSPRDMTRIGTLKNCGILEVSEAIQSCKVAFKTWKETSIKERSSILRKMALALRNNNEVIAKLESLDTGKVIYETKQDVMAAADCLEFIAGLGNVLNGMHVPISGSSYVYTKKEPLGVCLGIGAWNFPITIIASKVAPAIFTGNTIVYKPSESTPLTSALFAEMMVDCGLPPGVLNVVQGDGKTGSLLCSNEHISKVSFTGGFNTGKIVSRLCADTIKRITLELGGKSALVIFDDCDIDSAINGTLMANFFSQGQVCSNASRVYVQETIYNKFKELLTSAVKNLQIGDPFDESSRLGPLVSKNHFNKVQSMITKAIEDGATYVVGGDRITFENSNLNQGFYLQPCILENCHDGMDIVKHEIFGPVITLLSFKTEEDVIQRCNNNPFGLASGVFTKDANRSYRVASAFDSSTIFVNTYNLYPPEMSFGGRKLSGYGRENGIAVIDSYVDLKSVYVDTEKTPYPF